MSCMLGHVLLLKEEDQGVLVEGRWCFWTCWSLELLDDSTTYDTSTWTFPSTGPEKEQAPNPSTQKPHDRPSLPKSPRPHKHTTDCPHLYQRRTPLTPNHSKKAGRNAAREERGATTTDEGVAAGLALASSIDVRAWG